jgi:hypothetical protein
VRAGGARGQGYGLTGPALISLGGSRCKSGNSRAHTLAVPDARHSQPAKDPDHERRTRQRRTRRFNHEPNGQISLRSRAKPALGSPREPSAVSAGRACGAVRRTSGSGPRRPAASAGSQRLNRPALAGDRRRAVYGRRRLPFYQPPFYQGAVTRRSPPVPCGVPGRCRPAA